MRARQEQEKGEMLNKVHSKHGTYVLSDRPYREHLYCMVDKELNNKTQSLEESFRERQEVCRKTKYVEQRKIKGNPAHVDFGQQETLTR